VPLQALWVNLHGAYLFGPLLLALVLGCVVVMRTAAIPDQGAAFTARDQKNLAAVLAASLLACMLNPYGYEILGFSVEVTLRSGYIKEWIKEWQSPLTPRLLADYHVRSILVLGGLLWASILLRARDKPVLDAAIAALTTYTALRARRFVPYAAIFALPILLRVAREGLAPWLTERALRRRPLLDFALAAFLPLTFVAYGHPFDASWGRPIGISVSTTGPVGPVNYAKAAGLRGNAMNAYEDGAFIVYSLYPEVRPVADSRIDVFGPKLVRQYRQSMRSPGALFAFMALNCTNLVLMSQKPVFKTVYGWLRRNPAAKLLYEDPTGFLFAYDLKRGGGTRAAHCTLPGT
jgi:hypothetical protein